MITGIIIGLVIGIGAILFFKEGWEGLFMLLMIIGIPLAWVLEIFTGSSHAEGGLGICFLCGIITTAAIVLTTLTIIL